MKTLESAALCERERIDTTNLVNARIAAYVMHGFLPMSKADEEDATAVRQALRRVEERLEARMGRQGEQAAGWQPIESAPKDEGVLLAYKFGLGVAVAHKTEDGRWIGLEGTDWGDGLARFSHWMPLPPTPSSEPAHVE